MSQKRCGEEIPQGTVLEDRVMSPGSHWASIVPQGAVLRIVDLERKQAVDFLCYAAKDPSERYNAADTMKGAWTIFVTKGHSVVVKGKCQGLVLSDYVSNVVRGARSAYSSDIAVACASFRHICEASSRFGDAA